jgi:hypothetical protein
MSQYLTRRGLLAGSALAPLLSARDHHPSNAQGAPLSLTNPTPTEKMQRVLRAWELTDKPMGLAPGVSVDEFVEAERLLGWAIPETMRMLYERGNGYFSSFGVTNLWPLSSGDPEALSLLTGSDMYRTWEWPIPEELVLFGDSGGEEAYGLWMPETGTGEPVIVELGECFDPACLAIVGDDLASFLLGRSADWLLLVLSDFSDTNPMLDVLGVPAELRVFETRVVGTAPDIYGQPVDIVQIDEEVTLKLFGWANPGLPDPLPDAYERPMTADEINAFVASRDG